MTHWTPAMNRSAPATFPSSNIILAEGFNF
jgi:hypothetical protein